MKAVLQWVLKTMMKDQTGIVRTMPKKDLVDFNVAMTVERLLRNGIDPNSLKNANQVENAINQIEAPKNVQQGIKSTQTAKVFDMEGKEIKNPKNIMGGKEIPDDDLPPPGSRGGPEDIAAPVQSAEETIKNMIEAENKKNIAKIKNRKIIKEAIDNVSPGFVKGDRKYNAQLVAEELAEKKFGKDFYDLDQKQQIDLYNEALDGLSVDLDKFAGGGRAGFSQGLGIKFLKFLNENNPVQAYKKYLQSVKTRAQENPKELLPEMAAITSGGVFINRRMQDILKNMKEKDMENNLENFREELNKDPFYQKYPKLKDKTIEAYTEKMFGEKRADGGRAGFKLGGIDKARRAFLKAAAGITGGIAALKTGLLNIGKGADTVKNLPPIKTPVTKLEGTTTEMPDWFPSFINKFRDEGKAKDVFKTKKVEVSKEEFDQAFKEGKGENYFSDVARTPEYKANNPDHMDYYKRVDTDERIYTTYTNDKIPGVRVDDMDGNVDVMFENDYSQPVSLNYTAPGKKGPETGRADVFVQGEAKMEPKPKGEFVANDVEVYATDPDGGSEAVDVIADTVDDMLEGKTRQMEEYVTGKKTKLSKGEDRMIEAEIRAEQAADAAAEAAADAADEFSSGGIARMLGE